MVQGQCRHKPQGRWYCKRMVGIFINIEKKRKQSTGYREELLFTMHTLNLTFVNIMSIWMKILLNPFKETDPLFGMLENNRMWDELTHEYIEHFVYEEDKDAVEGIYDRNYILRKFKEGKNELSLVSRILKDGRIRW